MRRYSRLGYPLSPAALGLCVAAAVVVGVTAVASAEVIELEAKETLTALEMDHGDELRFRLRDGRRFTLVLDDTDAAIVERVTPGGIVYRFGARVRVDGQPMTLQRYVCSQECFCEPYVIDGVRIWLDTVQDVFDLIPIRYPRKGNLRCLPRKAARLAVQDATLRICPDETHPWIDDERDRLDVGACYNGDDCYLGPYLGQACHVGMDVNHPKGNPLFAPIDFDTQAYFNSLALGHNNNRWQGHPPLGERRRLGVADAPPDRAARAGAHAAGLGHPVRHHGWRPRRQPRAHALRVQDRPAPGSESRRAKGR